MQTREQQAAGELAAGGTAGVESRANGQAPPASTNAPPPPKHKNNLSAQSRVIPAFSALDEQRERALAAGVDADRDIAEAMLGIARTHRLLCVTESQSDLGRELHVAAVMRRISHGEPGAFLLDAHYVLTEEAHTEELAMAARARKAGRA